MAALVQEVLPPSLDSKAEQPPLFDGTTRFYTSYTCPYAQRVWITRNYKGLQDQIKIVALNLKDRPTWFPEKVYPENKVPALEHNGKIIGESVDVIKYIEANFEGPSLMPEDPARREFAEELFQYIDTFTDQVYAAFRGDTQLYPAFKGNLVLDSASAFDYLENALGIYEDGPFFLGPELSLVDITYITNVERFEIFLSQVWKHDITANRPRLGAWIEEMNKIDAYKQTKIDPIKVIELYKTRYPVPPE